MNPHPSPGISRSPVAIFLGIVGLSVVFFFAFTFPRWSPSAGAGRAVPEPPQSDTVADRRSPSATPQPSGSRPDSRPARRPANETPVFARPGDVVREFCGRLRAGDFARAFSLVAPEASTGERAEFLKHLLTNAGFALPDGDAPFADAGRASPIQRFSLRLVPAADDSPAPAGPVWVDAIRNRETSSWQIAGFHYHDALIAQAADLLRSRLIVINPAALQSPPDPLIHAHIFFDAVLRRDFAAARALTDRNSVTQEKLAGLCIVFEEGGYQLADADPVTVTAPGSQAAWAIASVVPRNGHEASELGLEMKRASADGPWTVAALDFSRMLENYVKATGAGRVYYTPIVSSPQGGESLVLYFEFDDASIVPRARRQLEIVAGLLATDPAKKLRISGHADALGADDYNFRLSAVRARNVRDYLIRLGVNPVQIETIGFGATAPLDPNRREDGSDNPEGRSRNRRTEIYLDF